MAAANTPYIIGNEYSNSARSILTQLTLKPVARELTNLPLSCDGDVVALDKITRKPNEYNIYLIAAPTSIYANRLVSFVSSVKDCHETLMKYHQVITSNSPMKTAKKLKAQTAFQKIQSQLNNELRIISRQVKARLGTPLKSADRAINIAKNNCNVAKLNVTSHVQANNPVQLSKQAKFLGNGLAVIDFGSRIGNVHTSYQGDRNWERDLFIESSSFNVSAGSGVIVVNAGTAALGLLMVATPIGVGGLAVAGTAAAVSIGTNVYTKEKRGSVYDGIMKAMSML